MVPSSETLQSSNKSFWSSFGTYPPESVEDDRADVGGLGNGHILGQELGRPQVLVGDAQDAVGGVLNYDYLRGRLGLLRRRRGGRRNASRHGCAGRRSGGRVRRGGCRGSRLGLSGRTGVRRLGWLGRRRLLLTGLRSGFLGRPALPAPRRLCHKLRQSTAAA